MISKFRVPSDVKRPSHIVLGLFEGTNFLDLNDWYASWAFSGSHAITLVFGDRYFAANAVPLRRPPPPTGQRIISREIPRFHESCNNSIHAVD